MYLLGNVTAFRDVSPLEATYRNRITVYDDYARPRRKALRVNGVPFMLRNHASQRLLLNERMVETWPWKGTKALTGKTDTVNNEWHSSFALDHLRYNAYIKGNRLLI